MTPEIEKKVSIFVLLFAPEYGVFTLLEYLWFKMRVGGPGWFDIYQNMPEIIQKEKGTMDIPAFSNLKYDRKKRIYTGDYSYFLGAVKNEGQIELTYSPYEKLEAYTLK